MNSFFRERWLLFAVLVIFTVLKIPHLSYPYYWDECTPYATAIKAMHDHGISLLPNAIDTELSRGHPMLFHVAAALWMKIFGASHVAMHSFALLISLLLLITVYEAGLRLFNPRVACMALLLVALQEVFFVQSSFVLLEVSLALLGFLSLYFYSKEQYLYAALSLTALFYTKESGLIMGFVLGIDALASFFYKEGGRRAAVYRLLAVSIPCIFAGMFFLLNKLMHGWYIFPFHSGTIVDKWNAFWYQFRMGASSDQFFLGLRHYYYMLLGIIAIAAAVKNKKTRYLAILVPVAFMYYFIDDTRAGRLLPSVPFFILFIAGWFWMVYVLSHRSLFAHAPQRRFVALAGCFILCFLGYSTMNILIYRYLLISIVPMLFITAVLFDVFITHSYKVLYYVSLVVIVAVECAAFATTKDHGDAELGAFDAMAVQQQVASYMETNGYHDKIIGTGSNLERMHLADAATGFLKKEKVFKNVSWKIDGKTELALFDNIEPDDRRDMVKNDTTYILAFRYQKGSMWGEVYKRKTTQ